MQCPECDHPVLDTARFCEDCGTQLHGEDVQRKLAALWQLELAGKLEEAATAYEDLVATGDARPGSTAIRKHLGNLHFRLGHLRLAREHLRLVCELEPDNATVWHDLGVVDYHMAEFDGAVTAFRRALDLGRGLELSYFWLGNALYHRGDHDEAAEAFRCLIARYPNFTIARFHLGVIYARQGLREEAEREFRRVLRDNPEAAAARFYVAG